MDTPTLIVLNTRRLDREDEYIQFQPKPGYNVTQDSVGIAFWEDDATKVFIPWTSIQYMLESRP